MGGVNLQQLTSQASVGESFATWGKVATVLEEHRMPPKGMPQPADDERQNAAKWIRTELATYFKKHDGDPGRVTVRRLTSGEYAYAIHDLTGIDPDTGVDASSDSVGGEGFTNFGDVQFMQDANLERYLAAAKKIANHAVIGSGPLEFYVDPGKTGFELSAITRIKNIYGTYGFRTVSGEGGIPFGLDKYGKAFYVAWRYKNRVGLGEPNATLKDLAAQQGVSLKFSQHIWEVVNRTGLSYPSSEMVARWQKLPTAGGTDPTVIAAAAKLGCDDLQKYLTTWPSWLFGRGDVAAGGAGDESPLVFNDNSLKAEAVHHFLFNRARFGGGGRGAAAPAGPPKQLLNVAVLNPSASGKPVIIWRNPTVGFRAAGAPGGRGGRNPGTQNGGGAVTPPVANAAAAGQNAGGAIKPPVANAAAAGQTAAVVLPAGGGRGFQPAMPRIPLRAAISEETAKRLNFGHSPDGSTVGPDDFATEGSVAFELVVPEGQTLADFMVDAAVGADRDQVFRITLSDREEGPRGIPTRTILGDPASAGYR
ncbi:MAG TPA: DUF1587 domain-containing protein, partial [Tepidisphaeraceae bacterium]|nr:DUF1587 domain-containing protein [Tepidisphaeraceae bacterium]